MSDSENWKNQPPYGGFGAEKARTAEWSGGCHCGRIKYEIYKKQPLDVKFCHCTTCQKMHGAPFQWAAIFDKKDICFLNGAADLKFYNTKEHIQDHILPYRSVGLKDGRPKYPTLDGQSEPMCEDAAANAPDTVYDKPLAFWQLQQSMEKTVGDELPHVDMYNAIHTVKSHSYPRKQEDACLKHLYDLAEYQPVHVYIKG
ncbi:hypothetical protein KEM56_000689 [Ascosphaera pollenicola]|nr:hypothetical protein KEM56_000689 [Ascosphaera pollenicola]